MNRGDFIDLRSQARTNQLEQGRPIDFNGIPEDGNIMRYSSNNGDYNAYTFNPAQIYSKSWDICNGKREIFLTVLTVVISTIWQ
jgi:hypothetical protein